MEAHTLELLDFPSITSELRRLCFSPNGAARIGSEPIETEPEAVRGRRRLACAFRRVLESGKVFPNLDFPDLAPLLPKAAKPGVVFEAGELAALGRFLVSSLRLRRHLERSGEEGLAAIAAGIPDLRLLSREIFSRIDTEGSLRENHIPELRALRDRMRLLEKDAERLAQAYLNNPEYRPWWQSDLPSQKNGRLVLALKSNFKGRLPGIVHEVSATGATLFLEPLDIVEKNNAITEQESRFRREVHRILRELSAKVTTCAAEVQTSVETIAELDALYARACFAIKHRCFAAEDLVKGLNLREARHPLLGAQAVPITLALDAETRVLIITGPNTGGKTVTLKTVGLLALMNQFGMEIPAAEGSGLAVFDAILADIGDEQSLQQSLSTFSAHIINAARIIHGSSSGSLVLFDELGAGTDPEEGVAVAMSLLDHFIEKGCCCLASTHHGILKNYGYTRPGVQNASMEFDLQNLQPTFRILMGIPGESHALEIARRNGIPSALIARAAQYLQEERGEIAELVKRLSERQFELLKNEERQRSRERELREKARQTDLLSLRLRQKEIELEEHGLGELNRFLRESRREYEQIVHRLRQEGAEQARREALDFFHKMEGLARSKEQALALEQGKLAAGQGGRLYEGMEVFIRTSGQRGTIIRKAKDGRWIVSTENLRVTLPSSDLRPVEAGGSVQGEALSVTEELAPERAVHQLDVRGMRLEEALRKVEQQLDRALISGLAEFSIIHGLGEGILQKAVHGYLRQCSSVKDYYFSSPEQGGFGRTIVKLV